MEPPTMAYVSMIVAMEVRRNAVVMVNIHLANASMDCRNSGMLTMTADMWKTVEMWTCESSRLAFVVMMRIPPHYWIGWKLENSLEIFDTSWHGENNGIKWNYFVSQFSCALVLDGHQNAWQFPSSSKIKTTFCLGKKNQRKSRVVLLFTLVFHLFPNFSNLQFPLPSSSTMNFLFYFFRTKRTTLLQTQQSYVAIKVMVKMFYMPKIKCTSPHHSCIVVMRQPTAFHCQLYQINVVRLRTVWLFDPKLIWWTRIFMQPSHYNASHTQFMLHFAALSPRLCTHCFRPICIKMSISNGRCFKLEARGCTSKEVWEPM